MLFYNCSVFIYSTVVGRKCEINIIVIVNIVWSIATTLQHQYGKRQDSSAPRHTQLKVVFRVCAGTSAWHHVSTIAALFLQERGKLAYDTIWYDSRV